MWREIVFWSFGGRNPSRSITQRADTRGGEKRIPTNLVHRPVPEKKETEVTLCKIPKSRIFGLDKRIEGKGFYKERKTMKGWAKTSGPPLTKKKLKFYD